MGFRRFVWGCEVISIICMYQHIHGRCSDLNVVLFISLLNQDFVVNIIEALMCVIKLFLLNENYIEFFTINTYLSLVLRSYCLHWAIGFMS